MWPGDLAAEILDEGRREIDRLDQRIAARAACGVGLREGSMTISGIFADCSWNRSFSPIQ